MSQRDVCLQQNKRVVYNRTFRSPKDGSKFDAAPSSDSPPSASPRPAFVVLVVLLKTFHLSEFQSSLPQCCGPHAQLWRFVCHESVCVASMSHLQLSALLLDQLLKAHLSSESSALVSNFWCFSVFISALQNKHRLSLSSFS